MAFPNDVDSFLQAVDPSTSQDIANIKRYQSQVESGDFSGAKNFLASLSNGIQMSLNAGRYNKVIDAIADIEQFYVGLGGVKEYILNNASAFTNYKQWDSSYSYSVGNIAGDNGNWYSCIQENTGIQPGVSSNWGAYWQLILERQPAIQYPIQGNPPTGQLVGDLWLKWVDDPAPRIEQVFGDNTPATIKYAFDNDIAPDTWALGDEVIVTLTDGTQQPFVLYDMQRGRYQRVDSTDTTNAVLGAKNCIASAGMLAGESTDVTGGWAESRMKTVTMEEIYNKLPTEWQAVISEVKVASTTDKDSATVAYSNNKIFLPARVELGAESAAYYLGEGTTFDYFVGESTDAASSRRTKTGESERQWWTRSIMWGNDSYDIVGSDGAMGGLALPYAAQGVSPCFAI